MKTVSEWSLAFDLLYNNITSNKAPGLEEYEKSVFLTMAQESIVIGLYNGKIGNPFESTEEAAAYIDSLIKVTNGIPISSEESALFANAIAQCSEPQNSYLFKVSVNGKIWFRTLETCTITTTDCGNISVPVIPVTQDEYWRTVRDPFRRANGRRVLRMSFSDTPESERGFDREIYTQLISTYPVVDYTVRYLERPFPIILVDDLKSTGLTINGETDMQTCKLHEALHQLILAEAVRLAKVAWIS